MEQATVSNRGFRALIRSAQNVLQIIGKRDAKNIKRDLMSHDGSCNVVISQTNYDDIRMHVYDTDIDMDLVLRDGKIQWLGLTTYNDITKTLLLGDKAVEAAKPVMEKAIAILQSHTPKGLMIEDVRTVGRWVQGNSKGSSGRCTRKVDSGKHVFRVWTTPGGDVMINTTWGPKDLFVNLYRKGFTCSFTEARGHIRWFEQDYNNELRVARKFLRRNFPQAFSENIIRSPN